MYKSLRVNYSICTDIREPAVPQNFMSVRSFNEFLVLLQSFNLEGSFVFQFKDASHSALRFHYHQAPIFFVHLASNVVKI